jgi:WD40 repeat protein
LYFASGSDGEIHAWDINLKEHVSVLAGHKNPVTAIAVEGHTMVSGSSEGTVIVWNLLDLKSRKIRFPAPITAVAISPVHKYAVIGLSNGQIWNLKLKEMDISMFNNVHDSVASLSFAPTGEWFVSTGADKQGEESVANVWELGSAKPTFKLTEKEPAGTTQGMTCSAISADGDLLVTGSRGGVTRVYRFK